MRILIRKIPLILVVMAITSGILPLHPVSASSTISLTSEDSEYFQDFNTLSNTVESAALPVGWTFVEIGVNANGLYQASSGSPNSTDTFSFGSADSTDRALGGIQGANLIPWFGASFTNQTGKVIDSLTISYTGEQWYSGNRGRKDKIVLEISTDATSLETGIWDGFEDKLAFFTPDTQSVGSKNGNSPAYRTELSAVFNGFSIENGQTFWIRWRDHDARDNDDGLAVDDFSLVISVREDSPFITSIFPADSSEEVDLNTELNISFSEPVTLLQDWLEINCTQSGSHQYTVIGSNQNYTVQLETQLDYDEICSLTILADHVSDTDTDDPPDGLKSDFVSAFSTPHAPDNAPSIISILPENNEEKVLLDRDINILFSEAVDLESGWFELDCGFSGLHAVAVNGGPQDFLLNPVNDFSFGETCSLTILADKVTDQDLDDPPDSLLMDQSISFTTLPPPDTAPLTTSTSPANGDTDIPINSNITIDFSEAVTYNEDLFNLICEDSGNHTANVSIAGQRITINPANDFDHDESCSLTIPASAISDVDLDDPPDQMNGDVIVNFSTESLIDLAPYIVNTAPVNNALDVPTNGVMKLTFSEPVTLSPGWVDFVCIKSGNQMVYLDDGPINYTFAAQSDLAYADVCTITLNSSRITDQDIIDPPDQMVMDYSFSFSTQSDPDILPYPVVVLNTNTSPLDGTLLESGINHLSIQFSKDMLHDGSEDSVDNPQNYRLFSIGQNRIFDTISCGDIIHDDQGVSIDTIVFDPVTNIANLYINNELSLPDDIYRLILCGEHTIRDNTGNPLNNGTNSYITFTIRSTQAPINNPASDANSVDSKNNEKKKVNLIIPVTGFSPGLITNIPQQTVSYSEQNGLWLEIPVMDISASITGVPKDNGSWEVTWLNNQAGWLDGSAFPGSNGNSVLTGHVWNANNQPGIFSKLNTLKYDDQVIIHAFEKEYRYKVREVLSVKAEDVNAMLKHQESPWITLVTCQGYDDENGSYQRRILVRAELIEIQ